MKTKKVLWIILLMAIVIASIFVIINGDNYKNEKLEEEEKISVVVSNFASYDFLRAIAKGVEGVEIKFLLGPGKDSHSYEPTAQDLIAIQNSDLFVYIGGDMEEWAQKVISSLNTSTTKVYCIADDVEVAKKNDVDGVEEIEDEHEHIHDESAFEEHIWTSPKNAKEMVNLLCVELSKIDNKNAELYNINAENYIKEIENVDEKIRNVVENKVRGHLIFGDKMPMQYFIDYYGLKVSAAFSGCTTDAEPSSKTIAYLIDLAKTQKTPVIFYIELNNGKVAKTIADEVGNGCEALKIQTLHNVEKDDFVNGETYVSLMERNIEVLKKALQ